MGVILKQKCSDRSDHDIGGDYRNVDVDVDVDIDVNVNIYIYI